MRRWRRGRRDASDGLFGPGQRLSVALAQAQVDALSDRALFPERFQLVQEKRGAFSLLSGGDAKLPTTLAAEPRRGLILSTAG